MFDPKDKISDRIFRSDILSLFDILLIDFELPEFVRKRARV